MDIDEKDIDVRIEGNTLTVHGERKLEKEEKEENFRRIERHYGSFTRSFTPPGSVDTGQVSADYDKGMLKINLPKKAEAKPKQIKVNIRGEKALSKPKLPSRSRKTSSSVKAPGLAAAKANVNRPPAPAFISQSLKLTASGDFQFAKGNY